MGSERSVWKGNLMLNRFPLPVKLHTAVKEHTTKFGLVSPCHHSSIGYRYYCKECQAQVERSACKKGYRIDKTRMVVVEPSELEAILPLSLKTIDIFGFAPTTEFDTIHLSTPYYVSPDTSADPRFVKIFAVMVQALQLTQTVALGKIVKNDKEHLVAIFPRNGGLVLYLLWWADEIKAMPEIPQVVNITDEDVKMATTLISKMTIKPRLEQYQDCYQTKVAELIRAKLLGKTSPISEGEPKPVANDPMTAFKQSVEAVAV